MRMRIINIAYDSHTGQEALLADKRILVLEGSTKQPSMPYKEDAYNIRVVNLNLGSVELLKSKGVKCSIDVYSIVLCRAGCVG